MTQGNIKAGPRKLSFISAVLSLVALSSLLHADDVVIRISDADAQKAAITRSSPDYPPMARQMHVSGPVIVEAEVTADGDVAKVQPVSGNALLSSAAVNAVKKWKFKPFTAEGKPAKAVVRLSFNFTL
jgi:periplasmic protein TonB